MDFPGDMVSLLVIPKLPFPYPNELKEKQKEQYEALTVLIDHQTVGTVCQRLGTAWSQMAWPFD